MRPSLTSRTSLALQRWAVRIAALLLVAAALPVTSFAQQCSDSQFVQRAFGDLLFRAPDDATMSFYTPLVASAGRQAVAASIVASQEYAANIVGGNPTVVAGFYQKYLGRNPLVDDVTFWVSKEPTKDSSIISLMMNSTEYSIRASGLNPAIAVTKSRLINQIMLDLLGRNATTGELSFYASQTAQSIATAVMATDEYNTRVIQQAYQRMMHRAPSSADVSFMLNALKSSSRPDEDLLSALAGSAEYCNGAQQTATFAIVSPSDTYSALNTLNVPTNVNTLPAVPFGPVDAAANFEILTLGIQAASATDTSALQAQIDQLKAQVASDAATISDLQSKLAAAQQQATTDANTIATLQGQVNSLNGQVTSLQQQLATANATIATMQGQITSLQQQLATANASIAALQGQVTADAATITGLQNTVAALNAQLTAAAATMATEEQTIFDVASALLGHSPTKDAAVAVGNVAQQAVSQASGHAEMLREAKAAIARGNADVTKGEYADAIRAFRLAYLLSGNAGKHE